MHFLISLSMGGVVREFPTHKSSILIGLGASLVAIGLGIGSGEFVLWPYLTVKHGYGILWAAVVGIALQVFLNLEIQRYSVVTGKSAVSGFLKVSQWLSVWLLFSTILGFGWPGFASGSAYLFSAAFRLSQNIQAVLPYMLLGAAGLLLVVGSNSYHRIERFFRYVLPISFLVVAGLAVYYFDATAVGELMAGLIGKGDGYRFIPAGIDFAVFLGAFAYAGSGGNLLLGQGYYMLKKGRGMAQYGEAEVIASESDRSRHRFTGLRKALAIENVLVFGGMGLLTILMLSYLGPVLLGGQAVGGGFAFLLAEAVVIERQLGNIARMVFLLSGAVALFSVQLGVLDTLGRITADVIGAKTEFWYKVVVLAQMTVGMGIFLIGLREPLWLITIGAVCNALAMAVIAFVTLWMNKTHLPQAYRPSRLEQFLLGCIGLVYAGFFCFTVINALF
jgi:hypothetical protein